MSHGNQHWLTCPGPNETLAEAQKELNPLCLCILVPISVLFMRSCRIGSRGGKGTAQGRGNHPRLYRRVISVLLPSSDHAKSLRLFLQWGLLPHSTSVSHCVTCGDAQGPRSSQWPVSELEAHERSPHDSGSWGFATFTIASSLFPRDLASFMHVLMLQNPTGLDKRH